MTQISLPSPAAVTILLERSKIFSVAPGISSYVTVAIPAESVAATVSAASDFGPYLADREVTLNLFLGTVVYEVKDSAGGGSVSAASIVTALDAATPTELAEIQSSVSGARYWFIGTWAALQAATAADLALGTPALSSGYVIALVTDVRDRGLEVVWTGTRWKTRQDDYTLAALRLPFVGVTGTSEQQCFSPVRIPAKFLQVGDILDIWIASHKSAAATESMTTRMRIGATGGSSDAAVVAYAITGSAQIQRRYVMQVTSATTLRPITTAVIDTMLTGTEAIAHGSYATAATLPADITIGNVDTEQYLTVSVQMSGATQTPRVLGAFVRVYQ